MFKKLGYPSQISKSSLYAIGSPTTWPSLLAAMHWLVRLLEYIDKIEKNKDNRDYISSLNENDFFFQYFTKAYDRFMVGDDAMCKRLEDELERTFEIRRTKISYEV